CAQRSDPATGTWSATGSCDQCPSSTYAMTITALPDGRALVAGGLQGTSIHDPAVGTAFLYDPATGGWTQTGSMKDARYNHAAALLPNGKVLVSGGCSTNVHGCGATGGDTPIGTAELYDPATGTWT